MEVFRQIGRWFRRDTRREDRRRRRSGRVYNIDLIENSLSVFGIASANDWRYPELSYQSANRFPSQLFQLLSRLDLITSTETVADVQTFAAAMGSSANASTLRDLFAEHGSDKVANGYYIAYAAILRRLGVSAPLAILEIGMGTNNPSLVSSMGERGRPGASLRAFRDFLPAASIYGADVDRDILFREERITTAFVDQTRPETFDEMTRSFGIEAFDLIIDDGLHSVEANMNTILFAVTRLKPGGWVVIEDIPERTVIIWKSIVGSLNRSQFKARLVKAQAPYMVIAELGASGAI